MSKEQKEFYITSPIYYVNAEPHIGSAYTTMICDALMRFWKLYGLEKSVFTTGVDEHGGKIETTAQKLNKTPKEHCDEISAKFKELWTRLDIDYAHFIRTSSKKHYEFVTTFFNKVKENGDIYQANYTGQYCLACEDFKTERDLEEGNLCAIHKTPVQEYSENNYFFALSKYTEKLKKFLQDNPDFVQPKYRLAEVMSWIDEGLRDFPISRKSVKWGIPIPGDDSQTIYVWFDALLSYLTALSQNPSSLEEFNNFPGYTHIVGKDILRFHAVYWPAMLMSAGVPLPQKIFGHGFLTKDGQKMGKTTGNVIEPHDLIDRFGADAVRFYFMFNVPFGSDGDFTESSFIEIVNAYLANRIGNLFSRVFKLVELNEFVREKITLDENKEIAKQSVGLAEKVKKSIENIEPHTALAQIFSLVDLLNLEMNEIKPWNLVKTDSEEDKQKAHIHIREVLESLRIISSLLFPFIPKLSLKMLNMLGFNKPDSWENLSKWNLLESTKNLPEDKIVFSRIKV